jgi:hypothetical protein
MYDMGMVWNFQPFNFLNIKNLENFHLEGNYEHDGAGHGAGQGGGGQGFLALLKAVS